MNGTERNDVHTPRVNAPPSLTSHDTTPQFAQPKTSTTTQHSLTMGPEHAKRNIVIIGSLAPSHPDTRD